MPDVPPEALPDVPEPEVLPVPDVVPEAEPLTEPLAEPDVPAEDVLSVLDDEADEEAGGVVGVTTVELEELGEVAGVAVEPLVVVEELFGRSQPVAKAAARARAAATGTSFIEFSMDRLVSRTPAGGR